MPTRQTWKTKIRGVLRLFNSSSAKAARNEELEFTPSAAYSDDSEDYYSDDDELEGGKKLRKKGPLIIKPVLQECYECDPKSGRYMLVTAYHNKLDIRTLLKESSDFSWSDRLRLLQDCAEALSDIHSKGHVHKNIHPVKSWNFDDFLDKKFNDQDFDIHPDAIYTSRPLGELISRELELQDQAWEETEVTNTKHGDDNSNSEQLVESKTNEFQLKLELNFGFSSDLTKIINQNKSNERVDDGDNNDDESSSNNTTSPNTSVFDDSLTESSSNNATSPNTSVFDEESKHEDDTSN
ncbi:21447_t:CDS:2 [Rhizophagus irregularis]|nr:21447_t:CDS:2 [Rhizophagus irregularis]